MTFHELASNAAKQGALSNGRGHVDVTWAVDRSGDAPMADIEWIGTGGPRVKPPQRSGFGSRLVERGVTRELGGDVHLDYAPKGVRCHIRLPASQTVSLG